MPDTEDQKYLAAKAGALVIPPKQNPFSLYDFLGYAIPGAIFLYALLLLPALTEPTSAPIWQRLELEKPQLYLPFVLASYLAGHILSFVSSITVEKYALWRFGYPSKYLLGLRYAGYWSVEPPRGIRRIGRALVALLILPVTLLDVFFGRLLRLEQLYTKPLDRLLVDTLGDKVLMLLTTRRSIETQAQLRDVVEHDFFRLVYHYAVEHAPAHLPKMQNYVALYGFLRTTCIIVVVLSWVLLGLSIAGAVSLVVAACLLAATSLLAFLLFMGFMKFYRRFSLEALMALTAVFPTTVREP